MPLDDFDMILSNEFFVNAKIEQGSKAEQIIKANNAHCYANKEGTKERRVHLHGGLNGDQTRLGRGGTSKSGLQKKKREDNEYVAHLCKGLQQLRQHQLYVKKEKCKFAKIEIKFLGHLISRGYIRMDEGGVLVQARHHVAFESRKLDETEQQYSSHEKEMIVVIYFLEHWKHYLLGTTLVVDAKPSGNNLYRSASMELSPLEVTLKKQPHMPLDTIVGMAPASSNKHVMYKFAKTQQELLEEAKESLEKASKRMKNYSR
ncbi:hypothetical protein AAG906_010657 [Vitis piasezkii]